MNSPSASQLVSSRRISAKNKLFFGLLLVSKEIKISPLEFYELHYYIDCAGVITNEQQKYEKFDNLV